MKQYRYLTQILLPILAILSFTLVACDDVPIFFSLEKAYQTSDDRGLDDLARVDRIVYTGTRYFVLAQSVYQRDQGTSTSWARVTPPASGALCGGLEYFTGDSLIYAWFYNSVDLKPVGLYSRDPGNSPTAPWNGPITDSDWPTGGDWPDLQFRVHFLKAVNNQLVLSTSVYHANESDLDYDKTFYNLYYAGAPISGTDDFTKSFGTDLDNRIQDIEYDSASYWLITTPGVSVGDNPTFLYEDTTPAAPDSFADISQVVGVPAFWANGSDDPNGILYTPHSLYYAPTIGRLYLSGWHGRIFIHDGGGWSDWDILTDEIDRKTVEVSNDDKTVEFTAFFEKNNENQIFVGSLQYGFFYFPDTLNGGSTLKPSDIVAADSPYEYFPTELKNGGIRNFLVETENPGNIVFVCTAGAGLWRRDWDPEVGKWIWKQE